MSRRPQQVSRPLWKTHRQKSPTWLPWGVSRIRSCDGDGFVCCFSFSTNFSQDMRVMQRLRLVSNALEPSQAIANTSLGVFLLLSASRLPWPLMPSSSETVLIHYASGTQVSLHTVLKVLCFFASLCFAVIFYNLSPTFRNYCSHALSAASGRRPTNFSLRKQSSCGV